MPVVARGKNRECSFTTAAEFALRLAHLRERVRTEEVTVYASTLRSTPGHLRMQAFTHDALGRPLRWVMPETARALLGAALPVGSGRGGPLRRGRAPVSGSDRRPRGPGEGSHDLPVVEVRGLRPRDAASREHVPSALPGPESGCDSAPAAVPPFARPDPQAAPRAARWTTRAPWAAQPSWHPTSPGGAAEELKPCPRTITRLRSR